MSARRRYGLGIAGAIVALSCAPTWGQVAAGRRGDPTDLKPAAAGVSGGGGTRAAGGVRSEGAPVRLSFSRIVDDAFGVPSKAPRPISGLPRPRFPQNTRAGWIPGWARIPDLPQVKAKVPFTNRFVSRAEAERKKAAENPAPRANDSDSSQEQREQARRLREAIATGDTGTVRTIRAEEAARRAKFERSIDRMIERNEVIDGDRRRPDGRAIDGGSNGTPDARVLAVDSGSLTARERADRLVRAGGFESAAREYAAHLGANADDAGAARSLAVALLLAGKPGHAAEAILEAYRIEPGLAARPYDPSVLPANVSLRSLVTRSVTKADRAKTPGAWLLAAALAQAEGRRDVAARLVERARAAGLDEGIVGEFMAALSKEKTHAPVGGS